MRILYQNLLEDASLVATDEAPSYPVENLVNNTSLIEYRGTTNSATVTGTWTEDQDISAFALMNHSLTSMTLTLKDSGGGTLFTQVYASADLRFDTLDSRKIVYLGSTITGVREIELQLASLSTLYLGLFWCGQYLQTPPFNTDSKLTEKDQSKSNPTAWGVNWPEEYPSLEEFQCQFDGLDNDDRLLLLEIFRDRKKTKPMFVDRWEDSADLFPVLFSIVRANLTFTKSGGILQFNGVRFKIQEIR